jgi:dipeptidyl aminopeptidase/acylaminoacyl peptidase
MTRLTICAAFVLALVWGAVGLALARDWTAPPLDPAWQIVFRSYDAYNQTGVFIMNADGTNIRQLVVDGHKVENYGCAPGGDYLVVTAPRLYLASVAGEVRPVGEHRFPPLVFFGVDGGGERIAFATYPIQDDAELTLIDAGDGVARPLTVNRALDDMPALAPGGERLAYVTQTPGQAERGIVLMNTDGVIERRITTRGILPAWSPDGALLAFQVWEYNNHDVYLYDVGHGFTRQVTAESGQETYPAWSPDGNWLAFATSETGSARVAIMRPDGSERHLLNQGVPLVATAPCFLRARPMPLVRE